MKRMVNVSWEPYCCGDFYRKCPSWPYGCAKCWKGRQKEGDIQLNVAIAGKTVTTILTLGHEFLHFLIYKLHIPTVFNKMLDRIDC